MTMDHILISIRDKTLIEKCDIPETLIRQLFKRISRRNSIAFFKQCMFNSNIGSDVKLISLNLRINNTWESYFTVAQHLNNFERLESHLKTHKDILRSVIEQKLLELT